MKTKNEGGRPSGKPVVSDDRLVTLLEFDVLPALEFELPAMEFDVLKLELDDATVADICRR